MRFSSSSGIGGHRLRRAAHQKRKQKQKTRNGKMGDTLLTSHL
jgi:hypothetical protein